MVYHLDSSNNSYNEYFHHISRCHMVPKLAVSCINSTMSQFNYFYSFHKLDLRYVALESFILDLPHAIPNVYMINATMDEKLIQHEDESK